MSVIYLITNLINNKKYVGKTCRTIEQRFKEHIKESKKEKSKDRPLYRAINKYGEENFKIELVEKTDNPEEREKYWIEFYNSYGSTGYNATKGGDGKAYINEELILFYLKEITTNCSKIAKILEYDDQTVIKVARKHSLYVKSKTKETSLTEDQILYIKENYIPKKFGKRKLANKLKISVHKVEHEIYKLYQHSSTSRAAD